MKKKKTIVMDRYGQILGTPPEIYKHRNTKNDIDHGNVNKNNEEEKQIDFYKNQEDDETQGDQNFTTVNELDENVSADHVFIQHDNLEEIDEDAVPIIDEEDKENDDGNSPRKYEINYNDDDGNDALDRSDTNYANNYSPNEQGIDKSSMYNNLYDPNYFTQHNNFDQSDENLRRDVDSNNLYSRSNELGDDKRYGSEHIAYSGEDASNQYMMDGSINYDNDKDIYVSENGAAYNDGPPRQKHIYQDSNIEHTNHDNYANYEALDKQYDQSNAYTQYENTEYDHSNYNQQYDNKPYDNLRIKEYDNSQFDSKNFNNMMLKPYDGKHFDERLDETQNFNQYGQNFNFENNFYPNQFPNQYFEKGDQPLYVNVKQFHCIRKRKMRRDFLGTLMKQANSGYLHESRHRHAMNRLRAPSGRFLTKEETAKMQKDKEDE